MRVSEKIFRWEDFILLLVTLCSFRWFSWNDKYLPPQGPLLYFYSFHTAYHSGTCNSEEIPLPACMILAKEASGKFPNHTTVNLGSCKKIPGFWIKTKKIFLFCLLPTKVPLCCIYAQMKYWRMKYVKNTLYSGMWHQVIWKKFTEISRKCL